MVKEEVLDSEQSPVLPVVAQKRAVEIPNTYPVRLQTLDLARHIAVAPDGKRYVVATYDDTHLGRGYVTAVYPQQNGYLTLYRLMICELFSKTPDQAVQQQIAMVQVVQQGRLSEFTQTQV
jgi:hypothetical protein